MPSGTVGTAYADTFTASGGTLPYTWSVNSLPANLTLNPTTGTISGTPTTAGSFSFTVRVIDKASAIADKQFVLNISHPQPAVTVVSAASMTIGPVAPESWTTAFGNNLALGTTATPSGQPLPTTLGETTVTAGDAAGTTRPAELLYVSPGQINFLTPADTSSGTATVTVTTKTLGSNLVHTAQVQIAPVAPSLFTLNGESLAAAYITRVRPGQPQTNEALFALQNGSVVAKPIDLGPATDQVYLVLYGTGVRNAGTGGVSVDIEGLVKPVSYAGAQNQFEGLDQINVLLPRSLAGSGDVSVVLTAAGLDANTVHIRIQ